MSVPKGKEKFALWIFPDTKAKVKEIYRKDDCRSMSEFVEKAIRFYVGYLTAGERSNYLPNMFLSTMHAMIHESDTKQNRMLFKFAVELAMIENILANLNNFDPVAVARLRGACVEEVKEINGTLTFEDAVDWQDTWEK